PRVRLRAVLGQYPRRRGGADAHLPSAGARAMITAETAAFRAALPARGRLAGLDVGTKTIGIALCDAGWTIASAAETIARRKFSVDLTRLREVVTAQAAAGLVIGLPLSLDGRESPRTQATRAFARNVAVLGLPILLWD